MDKLILKYWYITPAFPLAGLIQIIDILFIIIQFRFKHLVTKPVPSIFYNEGKISTFNRYIDKELEYDGFINLLDLLNNKFKIHGNNNCTMFREYLGTYNKKSVFGNVISKTYNEVQMYTDNLASYIIDKNFKKILIYEDTCPEWLYSLVAILKCKDVQLVTMYATLGEDKIESILNESTRVIDSPLAVVGESISTQAFVNPCCILVCAVPSPLIVKEFALALTTGVEPMVMFVEVDLPVIASTDNVLMRGLHKLD